MTDLDLELQKINKTTANSYYNRFGQ
jgi:hypothetical protein